MCNSVLMMFRHVPLFNYLFANMVVLYKNRRDINICIYLIIFKGIHAEIPA